MNGKIIHMHLWAATESRKPRRFAISPVAPAPFRINWETLRYHLPECRYVVDSCREAWMTDLYLASAKPCGACKPPHHGRDRRPAPSRP